MIREDELFNAIKRNKFDILTQKCEVKSAYLEFSFKYAITHQYLSVVKVLMETPEIDPGMEDNYAIIIAVKNNNIEITKLLLASDRINPGINFNAPIKYCVENNQIEILRLLLDDARTDVSDAHNTAFIIAIRNQNMEIIRILISHLELKEKLTPELLTESFISACEAQNIAIVKLLYEKFPDKKEYYDSFNDVLCASVASSNLKITEFLLQDYRADPKYNNSYMQRIAKTKQMKALIDNAVKRNTIMNSDMTPEEMAQKLIQYGFVNISNNMPTKATFKTEGTMRKLVIEYEFKF